MNKRHFLDKVVEGTWSINRNAGLVDVNGNVDISNINITAKYQSNLVK